MLLLTNRSDQLEVDFGTAILSSLVGQPLTRNRQPVRLFDQTTHTAEFYYRTDQQGKPYVHDHALDKRYYPLTAYCQAYEVDYSTAIGEICRQYGIEFYNDRKNMSIHPPARPRPISVASTPTNTTFDELPMNVYRQSQSHLERNGFYHYLSRLFSSQTATQLFAKYQLGTSRRWQYEQTLATCLPQIDLNGKLRQVKVIPFHPQTGRRAKSHQPAQGYNQRTNSYEPDSSEKVWFAGKQLASKSQAQLRQCYFGEHLLTTHPNKKVALVEGESTAIVCSFYWPEYVWLATGGSTGCRWYDPQVAQALANRDVVLWPDTGKYEPWCKRANELKPLVKSIRVSRYLEDHAPTGKSNLDLRDLLTWPCWRRADKLVFGEVLEMLLSNDYPPEWDLA